MHHYDPGIRNRVYHTTSESDNLGITFSKDSKFFRLIDDIQKSINANKRNMEIKSRLTINLVSSIIMEIGSRLTINLLGSVIMEYIAHRGSVDPFKNKMHIFKHLARNLFQ